MRKVIFFLIVGFWMMGCDDGSEKWSPNDGGGIENPDGEEQTVENHLRAKEMFDLIQAYYKKGNTGLYQESYPVQGNDPEYSYLWPYDGLVSAAVLLTRLGYEVNYTTLVEGLERYWTEGANGNSIGGYGSSTNGSTGGGTRYYDDNSIVGISLVEAYELTKNSDYLQRAGRIVDFLKSGEDGLLGGALWWNEDQKNTIGEPNSNKPSCANGYAAQFLLKYYTVCPASEKAEVLAFAKRLYLWLKENLQDPSDKCYWNDVNASGTINKTKWTYNTGVMVQNGIALYQITGEQMYLTDAVAAAQGAYDFFVKTRNGVTLTYPDSDPWFNTKLLRAYIDLEPLHKSAAGWIKAYSKFINHGYDNARTSAGFFYEDWTGANAKRYYSLLMQDAVVESYAALALYKGEKAEL